MSRISQYVEQTGRDAMPACMDLSLMRQVIDAINERFGVRRRRDVVDINALRPTGRDGETCDCTHALLTLRNAFCAAIHTINHPNRAA